MSNVLWNFRWFCMLILTVVYVIFSLLSCCRQQKEENDHAPEPPSKLFISCQSLFCYANMVLYCD